MDNLITVVGDKVTHMTTTNAGAVGSYNVEKMAFSFDSVWDGLAKKVSFLNFKKEMPTTDMVLGIDNSCLIPAEATKYAGIIYFSVSGTATPNDVRVKRRTISERMRVGDAIEEGSAPEVITPSVEAQLIERSIDSEINKNIVLQSEANAMVSENNSKISEDNSKASELASKVSELNAAVSELNADSSMDIVVQTMNDILAMMGSDIATLLDGKLNPAQIPALSINTVEIVANTTAMLLLTCERGDVALIVPVDVVTDSYILATDDPTVLSNWKKFGISYVANAGHAVTADAATDSTMINGHRLVTMTQVAYDVAVLDPDTFYLVTP